MGVVAVPVAQQQAMGHVEPEAGLEPAGRAGELGADRDVGLGVGHLDQPRRQPRGDTSARPRPGGRTRRGRPRRGARAAVRTWPRRGRRSRTRPRGPRAPRPRGRPWRSGAGRRTHPRRAGRPAADAPSADTRCWGDRAGRRARSSVRAVRSRSRRATGFAPRGDGEDPPVGPVPIGVGVGVRRPPIVPVGDVEGAVGAERQVAGGEPGIVGPQDVAHLAGLEGRAEPRDLVRRGSNDRAGRRRCSGPATPGAAHRPRRTGRPPPRGRR